MACLRRAFCYRIGLLTLLSLVAMVPPVLAQSAAQRIAAVVNDDVITTQDLADRLTLALATSGLSNDPQTRQRLGPQVLRGFVDEKVQLQEAQRLGLAVTDAEVDEAMETIAQRNKTNRADLTRYLLQQNLSPRSLRDQLRAQIAWIKIVNSEIRPRIVVTQEQVNLALKRGGAAASDPELLLSELLLPVYERAQEATVMNDATGLVATLRGGANFAALARQVSAAASAESGGDLGWVRGAAITPELRVQIEALKVGEITDPIISPAGVHIFQLRDRRAGTAAAALEPEQVRRTVEQEQLERQASRYLQGLRRDAFVDIRI